MARPKIPLWVVKLGMRYLPAILESISPQIREWIINAILELERQADKTDNKIDDFLVDLLKASFDMD